MRYLLFSPPLSLPEAMTMSSTTKPNRRGAWEKKKKEEEPVNTSKTETSDTHTTALVRQNKPVIRLVFRQRAGLKVM